MNFKNGIWIFKVVTLLFVAGICAATLLIAPQSFATERAIRLTSNFSFNINYGLFSVFDFIAGIALLALILVNVHYARNMYTGYILQAYARCLTVVGGIICGLFVAGPRADTVSMALAFLTIGFLIGFPSGNSMFHITDVGNRLKLGLFSFLYLAYGYALVIGVINGMFVGLVIAMATEVIYFASIGLINFLTLPLFTPIGAPFDRLLVKITEWEN